MIIPAPTFTSTEIALAEKMNYQPGSLPSEGKITAEKLLALNNIYHILNNYHNHPSHPDLTRRLQTYFEWCVRHDSGEIQNIPEHKFSLQEARLYQHMNPYLAKQWGQQETVSNTIHTISTRSLGGMAESIGTLVTLDNALNRTTNWSFVLADIAYITARQFNNPYNGKNLQQEYERYLRVTTRGEGYRDMSSRSYWVFSNKYLPPMVELFKNPELQELPAHWMIQTVL